MNSIQSEKLMSKICSIKKVFKSLFESYVHVKRLGKCDFRRQSVFY